MTFTSKNLIKPTYTVIFLFTLITLAYDLHMQKKTKKHIHVFVILASIHMRCEKKMIIPID